MTDLERIKHSRAVFEARPDYEELIAEADRRGFRRITLYEQMDIGWFIANSYSWRGGLWVKKEVAP